MTESIIGSQDITIKFVGELSEAQKEKVTISSYQLPLNGPTKYELIFRGSFEEVAALFPNNENTEIIVTSNIIDVTCKSDYSPREKDMSLAGQIESIIEDCEETDYAYNGEDEYPVYSFKKDACLRRIMELLDKYEIVEKPKGPTEAA